MEILLWLLPAVCATALAMAVAGWLGRDRDADAVEASPGPAPARPVVDEGVSAARVSWRWAEGEQPADPVQAPAPGLDEHERTSRRTA